jgi:hypothetical protein
MPTRAPRRPVSLFALAMACAHCSRVYHPDYHPQATYVQNLTYTRVYGIPVPPESSGADVAPGARAPAERGCALGRPTACWNECFHEGRGWSCELLSVMFRTGEGVFPDQGVANNLHARACALGQCGRPEAGAAGAGQITSPGSVVVYGDVNGNIVLGQ